MMAKILVIDDDPELLRMIQFALERRRGHEAILSADGADALAKAREDPPDLAIVDVMMPGNSNSRKVSSAAMGADTGKKPERAFSKVVLPEPISPAIIR
ncbi:MAG: response regulator, partial [Armatimonadota bacterium]